MVQAPAFTVAFITELFGKTTSIEVRATFAVFVNQTAIGEGRTVFVIQFRRFAVSDDVRNGREEVVRVRRAARNVDYSFARQNFLRTSIFADVAVISSFFCFRSLFFLRMNRLLTKLGQLSYDADKVEVQAENLRKMFLAMAYTKYLLMRV